MPDTTHHNNTLHLQGYLNTSALPTQSLSQDSLHALVPFEEAPIKTGFDVEIIPYTLKNDDWLISILIICLLATILIITNSKQYIKNQTKHLFFEKFDGISSSRIKSGRESRYSLFLNLQTGFILALLFFYYTLHTTDLSHSHLSFHLLITIYFVVICLVGLAKSLLYRYVNWIFFYKEQQFSWNRSYSFLISTEGVMLFPFILIAVFHHLPFDFIVLCVCILLGFVKLCLFYKTFLTFFVKFYGFLLFITYLCALEIVPIYALWQALTTINKYLL